MRSAFVGGVAVVAVLAAGGCGVTLSSGGAEALGARRIETFLQREFRGVEVTGVGCSDVAERGGSSRFTCAVLVMGSPVEVHVEEVDGDRFVRTEAVLEVAKIEAFVVQQYDEQVGVPVSADCSPDPVLVAEPGTVVDCTVVDMAGTSQTPKVTVENLAGDISLDLA